MRYMCKGVSFKMRLVRYVISAIAKVGQVGATQSTGLGGEPTSHFAVLKDFVFQQKLIPKYAKNGYYFWKFVKIAKTAKIIRANVLL